MNRENWEVKKLGEVCSSIVRGPFGSALKKDFFVEKSDSTYKVYEQKHAIRGNASIGSYYIDENRFKSLLRFEVKPHDIIMSCSGTIGKLFIIPTNAEKGIINQALLKFTLKSQLVTNSFFLNFLSTIIKDIDKKGSGIQNIGSVKFIKDINIPVPPLSIQEKIVKELDTLHNILAKKKEQLKELDKVVQATFYDMFGDPVENEKGWKINALSVVAPISSSKEKVNTVDGKYWLLNLDMIKSNTGELIDYVYENIDKIGNSTYSFDSGNVLYSKLRPYLNKVFNPNNSGYATTELVPLRPCPSVLNKTFLTILLRSPFFVSYIEVKVAGAKMPRVNMDILRNFPVILPPLSLQNQFATKIEAIDKQKELINCSINDVEQLIGYTMDKYFN